MTSQEAEALRRALSIAVAALEGSGCLFFACPGPTSLDQDMRTCHTCSAIRVGRRALAGLPEES